MGWLLTSPAVSGNTNSSFQQGVSVLRFTVDVALASLPGIVNWTRGSLEPPLLSVFLSLMTRPRPRPSATWSSFGAFCSAVWPGSSRNGSNASAYQA